ncbi:MAG: 4-(cytidine 5'-diphospho)-2-C-methyl-D-erythritol kinase [Lentisphaeria bacterium]|nr:4-(cytidine 5'-diphospho)-2-C-methyl-D-erythritol kinase [Lentisphaeria bacterium]
MAIALTAPCKVNLYLDVLGCRPDGYHDIATVFLPLAEPSDGILVQAQEGGALRVQCDPPVAPCGSDNLCWRAAELFAAATGMAPAWSIRIEKRIPVAAGLGGGSSDAAATLLALNRLHGSILSPSVLHGLATSLGADVPFFLAPRAALGTGVGEVLRPLAVGAPLALVLANPGFPVSASWAYGNLDRTSRPKAPPLDSLVQALARGDCPGVAAGMYNALGYAVADKFPLVAMLLEALAAAGCFRALVSGSGPTVFGICPAREAGRIAASLRHDFGEAVWTCAARSADP